MKLCHLKLFSSPKYKLKSHQRTFLLEIRFHDGKYIVKNVVDLAVMAFQEHFGLCIIENIYERSIENTVEFLIGIVTTINNSKLVSNLTEVEVLLVFQLSLSCGLGIYECSF